MRTLLAVCLDESGSMDQGGKRAAAISAFNEYLASQQQLKADECLLMLTKFNTTAWTMVPLTAISEVQPLSIANYMPNGGTALLDAVQQTIEGIERHIRTDTTKCGHCGTTKAAIADRVVVVILTDGEENSSKRATLDTIKSMIKVREATDHWTFVFLSASPNAWQQGAQLGIARENTLKWANTDIGTATAINTLGSSTTFYRQGAATATNAFISGGGSAGEAQPAVITIYPPAGTGG